MATTLAMTNPLAIRNKVSKPLNSVTVNSFLTLAYLCEASFYRVHYLSNVRLWHRRPDREA